MYTKEQVSRLMANILNGEFGIDEETEQFYDTTKADYTTGNTTILNFTDSKQKFIISVKDVAKSV